MDKAIGWKYDADHDPPARAWLALGEGERIELVRAYHISAGLALEAHENDMAHAVPQAVAETFIAGRHYRAHRKLRQLMKQGLTRHAAVHAIAAKFLEVYFHANRSAPLRMAGWDTLPMPDLQEGIDAITADWYINEVR